MSLTIHLGCGKTGTTSIQDFFFENREFLKDCGWCYPVIGLEGSGHHNLAPVGVENLPLEVVNNFLKLRELIETDSSKSFLISSEGFIFLSVGCIREIRELLHGLEVKIILYIRNQIPLIESTFLQWQKNGSDYCNGDIATFFRGHKMSFDFSFLLRPWEEVFGFDSIKIRLYDREVFGESVVEDFIRFAGVCVSRDMFCDYKKNQSIIPDFSKIITLFDMCNFDEAVRIEFIRELISLSDKFRSNTKFSLLDAELRNEIIDSFCVSNKNIADRYLSKAESKLFLGFF